MTDQPPRDLVLVKLEEIRLQQEALTHKVGTVATSLISMMKRLDDLDGSMNVFSRRQQEMTNTVQLVAVAVDDHTHQLTDIKTRLDRIEKKLDLTHA
jgi:tetrahydromethanopterin S-methyltransferase subunit G